MGHATRSIPLIRLLTEKGAEVLIASSGGALQLLRSEFPELKHYKLPAYAPVYPESAGSMPFSMGAQLPKFVTAIRREHAETEKLVRTENISAIISDNRYGCYSKKIPSVIVCHQLHLLMPQNWKWVEGLMNRLNLSVLSNFNECWIPANDDLLLGDLVINRAEVKHRFIGYLSRMRPTETKPMYDIVAMASGPSPQREYFCDWAKAVFANANELNCLLVRGEISAQQERTKLDTHTEVNFVATHEANQLLCSTKLLLARSGYSTIMDAMATGCKSLYVPTPLQTEQEYLAKQVLNNEMGFCIKQSDSICKSDIEHYINTSVKSMPSNDSGNLLSKALDSLL